MRTLFSIYNQDNIIPEHSHEFGSKGQLALQACCEACNYEIPIFVHITSGIYKVSENLDDIIGIRTSVDGLQDEDLFLGLEVAPLLTDSDICILAGCRHRALVVEVALFDQVLPGVARGGIT